MNYIQYINFTLRNESQKYQNAPSQSLVKEIALDIKPESSQAMSSISKKVKQTLQEDAAKRVTVGGQNI